MNKLDFKNIPFFPPVFHITPDSDIDHLHQKQQYNKVYQKDRFYPFSKVNCDSCTHYYHHNAKDIPAMSLLHPVGDIGDHRPPLPAEEVGEQAGGGDAVHVVVAVDRDVFPRRQRPAHPRRGPVHVLHEKRVQELAPAGVQKGAGLLRGVQPAGAEGQRRQGRHPRRLHGGPRPEDQVHVGFNLLPHVVVGVLEDELHRARAVLGVEVVRRRAQVLLAGLEPGPVMVAEDVVQLRPGLAALHVVEVVEALIPLGVGGGLRRGQHPRELQGNQNRVLHLVLGRAWVDVHPVEVHARVGRVEVLVLQLAQLAAIHSVGHRRAEALHVEMVGTLPNLLVRYVKLLRTTKVRSVLKVVPETLEQNLLLLYLL